MATDQIELNINGSAVQVDAEPNRMLLGVLRDELELTGSKYGCGEGQCGACTVLIDGKPRRSCITPVRPLRGKKIITIEGLAGPDRLHPVQEAFLEAGALQCGYCTPGMVMSAVGLLEENSSPSRDEIVEFMQGNICRCGTYTRIIKAIEQAAQIMREGR